jgi:hypothetical protein
VLAALLALGAIADWAPGSAVDGVAPRGVAESAAALADCPAPGAIAQRLQALRAPGASAPNYVVNVGRTDGTVTLTARDERGATWVRRELPASAPCNELEEAAAVVLLAWEAQLAPGAVPVPEMPAPPMVPAVMKEAAPEPAAAWGARVGASAQLWLSSASPTWGAQGSVELHGKRFGVELDVLGQGQRQLVLSPGRVTWSRFTVVLCPTVSLAAAEGLDVSVGAGLAAGPFWIQGTGFSRNFSQLDWDLGVTANAKALLPGMWRVRPFVAVAGVVWLRRHIAEAEVPSASALVPFVEVTPTLGLAAAL